jgi:uncharacterized membrane protein YphA (DoxX/SURF4 family)
MGSAMNNTALQRGLILYVRLAIGWTFLYAGLWQLVDAHFTVASFLAHTKTFHDVLAVVVAPSVEPYSTFAVN